jgi:hypothetical protein
MLMTDHPHKPPRSRRGTNVRQRQAQVSVRLTEQEYAAVKEAADRADVSPANVLRRAFFEPEATG